MILWSESGNWCHYWRSDSGYYWRHRVFYNTRIGLYRTLSFYNSKNFELYWGAVFFKDLLTHFLDFWSQIGAEIVVTTKQEVKRKSEWFCSVKFFHSNLEVQWENGVWTKIRFLASDFLFTYGNFTLIFTVFFQLFGSYFFLNCFSNPFVVGFRPSFLFEPNVYFSLVAHMRHFDIAFSVFLIFYLIFFYFLELVFPIHS